MRILLDTNILVRCIEPAHPHHLVARRAVARLVERGDQLCLVPQVLYEHFVVCTRPQQENGGLGMTNAEAVIEVKRVATMFEPIPESPSTFPLWLQLIERHGVVGKRAHDTRIAAALITNQLPAILTFNQRDFQHYPEIEVLDPATIAVE